MDLVLKKTEKLTSEKIRDIFVWVIVLFFMVALVFPLFFLGIKSLENTAGEYVGVQNFVQYLKNPGVMNSFLNTVKIATLSMVITLGIGFLYSYGVSRANLKGKNILKFLVLLPIFAPTMLHGISLVYLFGRMGLITTGFFGRLPWLSTNINLYGPVGIVISEVIYTLPQAYLIISIALANSDYRLYEAAETLGTSKIKQ
ncbi:MAG: putative 2-aminoethylphosphonate ABC transporter permease subunit, partial [Fusobacteriaceae bacterium]